MGQPAASRTPAEMESLLKMPLIERHARGVEPTHGGPLLTGRACDEIVARRSGRMGRASIGLVMNLGGTWLVPQAIAAFKSESSKGSRSSHATACRVRGPGAAMGCRRQGRYGSACIHHGRSWGGAAPLFCRRH